MKAIVKETGKIRKVTGVWLEDGSMIKPDKIQLIVGEGFEKEVNVIDWEQRRWELVKALAAGRMLRVDLLNYNKKSFVSTIVGLADDIIAEYRKGGEE